MVPTFGGDRIERTGASCKPRHCADKEEFVRQGEIAPKGKWEGVVGGVKAPEAIVLPDPAKRFANTSARLDALASGHPMEDWLRFMSRLTQAQNAAAATTPPPAGPDPLAMDQAVEVRMPPLSADGHRREAVWRAGLTALLDNFDTTSAPRQVLAVIAELRAADAATIEGLADGFLHGPLGAAQAGAALYIAAALQVYFTRMAAQLSVSSLRLLEQRGLCPCCDSTPSAGLVTASGQTPGARYLHCSLCATAWNHVRAVCITCGNSKSIGLEGVEGDNGTVKAETCNQCHTYSKMIYQKQDMKADPFADDLATVGLDILVSEAGWARHAANPLLLIG
jgi:FdhE protein